jgi:hypothetical protein
MVIDPIVATMKKAPLKNYFLAGLAMSNVHCSFCEKEIPETSEYEFDYDMSFLCENCDSKSLWFTGGILLGSIATAVFFYLLHIDYINYTY